MRPWSAIRCCLIEYIKELNDLFFSGALFLLSLSTFALIIFRKMRKPCRYFASKIFFNLSYEGKEQERIKFISRFWYSCFSWFWHSQLLGHIMWIRSVHKVQRFSLHVTTRNRLRRNRTASIVEFYQEYYQLLAFFRYWQRSQLGRFNNNFCNQHVVCTNA